MKQLLLCLTAFLFLTVAHGQFIFVDVIPDSCVCVNSGPTTTDTLTTYWDLDNNGTNDFIIESSSAYSDCMHGLDQTFLIPLGNNKVAGDSLCGTCHYAFMLNSGDTIDNQPSWLSSTTPPKLSYFNEFSGWSGHWTHDSLDGFHYAAIKFYAGSTLYYGWMKFNVVTECFHAKVVVAEYAYGICQSSCITGEVEIKTNNSLLVYPNPFSSSTTLHSDNSLHSATLTVDNCFGQTVKQIKNISGHTIPISRDNVPCGLYFLRLTEGNNTSTTKIIITD